MTEDRPVAKNWPFKEDNDAEALALGKAILRALSYDGNILEIRRRKWFLSAKLRNKVGKSYEFSQSCWNAEIPTLADGFDSAADLEQTALKGKQ